MEFEFDLTPLQNSIRNRNASSYDDDDPFAPDVPHSPDNQHDEHDEDPLNDDSVFGFDPDFQTKPTPVSSLSRIHTRNALHAISQNEMTTYFALLSDDPKAEVFVGPTHGINDSGNLHGFRLVGDAQRDCVNLPMTREMLKGSTCVECDPGDRDIHPDVIRLLSDPAAARVSILKVLAEIHAHEPETLVSLDHMPIAVDTEVPTLTIDDHYSGRERSDILLENLIAERIGRFSSVSRGRDSKIWQVDMPSAIGIFHAYVRSRDSGRREHKLFIVASGGCRRASEQYYNMNLDLVGDATLSEMESCEETWWLRRTCTRSRCRTVKLFAEALKLNVPMITDQYAFEENSSIPVFTVDTIENDISVTDDGRVALFNECVDTTSILNGIICSQGPSESPWVFLGSHQSSVGNLANFGGVFGDQRTCGLFPTGTIPMYPDEQHSYTNRSGTAVHGEGFQQTQDIKLNLYHEQASNHVVYYNPLTGREVPNDEIDFDARPHLVKFDDFLVDKLVGHGWTRSWDILQLIPIISAVEV